MAPTMECYLMDYCFCVVAPADSTCAASIFLQYFPSLAWFAFVGEAMEAENPELNLAQ